MQTATRAKFWLTTLIAGLVALGAWLVEGVVGDVAYIVAVLALFAFCGLGSMLLFSPREATHPLPDLLGQRVETYYDQGGFSFAPGLVSRDGTAFLQVLFQNRWAGPCQARVAFWAVDGKSKTEAPDPVPSLVAEISCDGGDFGFWETPYPIGVEWQGKEMIYDLACSVVYPEGHGTLVSHGHGGMRVGEIRSDAAEMLRKGALLLLTRRAVFSMPASFHPILPSGVCSVLSADPVPLTTILDTWDPDMAERRVQEQGSSSAT